MKFYNHRILRSIASRIQQDDLDAAIGLFIKELAKSIRRRSRRRSIYREFLFLAIVVFGRRNMSYGKLKIKKNKSDYCV